MCTDTHEPRHSLYVVPLALHAGVGWPILPIGRDDLAVAVLGGTREIPRRLGLVVPDEADGRQQRELVGLQTHQQKKATRAECKR